MNAYPLRLSPGLDLKVELESCTRRQGWDAACIVSAVGSLARASLRFAGEPDGTTLEGPFEIVGLVGTLSPDGSHLHVVLADGEGRCRGGHLLEGATVHTTVELVIGVLGDWMFTREEDPATGYRELVVRFPG